MVIGRQRPCSRGTAGLDDRFRTDSLRNEIAVGSEHKLIEFKSIFPNRKVDLMFARSLDIKIELKGNADVDFLGTLTTFPGPLSFLRCLPALA